jgi:hypothetical protein
VHLEIAAIHRICRKIAQIVELEIAANSHSFAKMIEGDDRQSV